MKTHLTCSHWWLNVCYLRSQSDSCSVCWCHCSFKTQPSKFSGTHRRADKSCEWFVEDERWRNEAVHTQGTHVILSDESHRVRLRRALGPQPSSRANNILQWNVKLWSAGTVCLIEKKQCSSFIFVGWVSTWLSNKRKYFLLWKIIIEQRATHSAQCNTHSVCVCACACAKLVVEQICPTDFR